MIYRIFFILSIFSVAISCGNNDANSSSNTNIDVSDTSDASDASDASTEICNDELISAIFVHDGVSEGTIETLSEEEEIFTSTITLPNNNEAPFLYVSFSEQTLINQDLTDQDALDGDWDMAFRSDFIRLNSGISGTGTAEITGIIGSRFNDIDETTNLNIFRVDELASECALPEEATSAFIEGIGDWHSEYTSRIYVLKTADGKLLKLSIDQFEQTEETTTYTLTWGPVVTLGCDEQAVYERAFPLVDQVNSFGIEVTLDDDRYYATIDATAGGREEVRNNPFLYIDLDNAEQVMITDKEAYENTDWDIAVRRVVFRVNGGVSGPGSVKVARLNASSLDEVSIIPPYENFTTDQYVDEECIIIADQMNNPETAIGIWFSFASGSLSSDSYVYLIETTEGELMKFHIITYEDGIYEVEWEVM